VDFERLIETEQQNDDLLRRTREEAARLVRATVEGATRRQDEAERDLEAAVGRARAASAERREAALATITTGAIDDAARFDAVNDDQVDTVVATLLADLAGGGSSP